jgi:hypothetical protein
MRYLVDGYNLLHATGHLAGKVTPHALDRARQLLLCRLAEHIKATGDSVTVVFDARRAPPKVRSEQEHDGVRVHYVVDAEADDRIEELIRSDTAPKRLTVVSNDKRLREAARRRRCEVLECVAFFELTGKHPAAPSKTNDEAAGSDKPSQSDVGEWMRAFGAEEDDDEFSY